MEIYYKSNVEKDENFWAYYKCQVCECLETCAIYENWQSLPFSLKMENISSPKVLHKKVMIKYRQAPSTC